MFHWVFFFVKPTFLYIEKSNYNEQTNQRQQTHRKAERKANKTKPQKKKKRPGEETMEVWLHNPRLKNEKSILDAVNI